jgi:hypothetical protein
MLAQNALVEDFSDRSGPPRAPHVLSFTRAVVIGACMASAVGETLSAKGVLRSIENLLISRVEVFWD